MDAAQSASQKIQGLRPGNVGTALPRVWDEEPRKLLLYLAVGNSHPYHNAKEVPV